MTSAEKDRRVRIGLLVTGTAITLAMFYGSGMRAQKKEIVALYEKNKIVRQDYRLSQLTVRAREANLHQLEARRLVAVAQTVGPEQAKPLIEEAAKRLRTASLADSATAPDLSSLASQLETLDTTKPTAKNVLESVVAAMDKEIPDSLPAPDSLSPVPPRPNENDKPVLGSDVTRVK